MLPVIFLIRKKGSVSIFFNEHDGHWLSEPAPAAWKKLADAKVNRMNLIR
ncbi:MAG: hypothetical protein JWR61_1899 [Ferruginibacter sp.]|nr:hypothetical protein [Ferruginibacter sp.]